VKCQTFDVSQPVPRIEVKRRGFEECKDQTKSQVYEKSADIDY
jgi:hypothetical protein